MNKNIPIDFNKLKLENFYNIQLYSKYIKKQNSIAIDLSKSEINVNDEEISLDILDIHFNRMESVIEKVNVDLYVSEDWKIIYNRYSVKTPIKIEYLTYNIFSNWIMSCLYTMDKSNISSIEYYKSKIAIMNMDSQYITDIDINNTIFIYQGLQVDIKEFTNILVSKYCILVSKSALSYYLKSQSINFENIVLYNYKNIYNRNIEWEDIVNNINVLDFDPIFLFIGIIYMLKYGELIKEIEYVEEKINSDISDIMDTVNSINPSEIINELIERINDEDFELLPIIYIELKGTNKIYIKVLQKNLKYEVQYNKKVQIFDTKEKNLFISQISNDVNIIKIYTKNKNKIMYFAKDVKDIKVDSIYIENIKILNEYISRFIHIAIPGLSSLIIINVNGKTNIIYKLEPPKVKPKNITTLLYMKIEKEWEQRLKVSDIITKPYMINITDTDESIHTIYLTEAELYKYISNIKEINPKKIIFTFNDNKTVLL